MTRYKGALLPSEPLILIIKGQDHGVPIPKATIALRIPPHSALACPPHHIVCHLLRDHSLPLAIGQHRHNRCVGAPPRST